MGFGEAGFAQEIDPVQDPPEQRPDKGVGHHRVAVDPPEEVVHPEEWENCQHGERQSKPLGGITDNTPLIFHYSFFTIHLIFVAIPAMQW